MGVHPDPPALRRRHADVGKPLEVVGDRFIVQFHGHRRRLLLEEDHVLDIKQRVGSTADPEPADFGRGGLAQVGELQERQR